MASGVKRIIVDLREEDHEYLKKLKGRKTWRDFIFDLVKFKEKIERESDFVPRSSLKKSYVASANALSEIGKVLMQEEEGYRFNDQYYLASLLPLVIAGEEVDENDLVKLYILVTSLVFNHLKGKYKDSEKYFLLEYLRTAIILELRGDSEGFRRLLNEVCESLRKLPDFD